jgi:hypothetical protein
MISLVHSAGADLEHLVSRLGAKLKGRGSFNSADYYYYSKGLYDGVSACLEAMAADANTYSFRGNRPGSPAARYSVEMGKAIALLRKADAAVCKAESEGFSHREDPDNLPNIAQALVSMLGALEAIYQHSRSNDRP